MANTPPTAQKGRARHRSSPSLAASRLTAWIQRDALPFWTVRGWDHQRGGFYERMTLEGDPDHFAPRRVRVQWRQIYTLAHASTLGWTDGLKLAFKGLEHIIARGWSPDGQPGFVHLLTHDNEVADAKRDSYDHAFALLALAWLAKASDDAQVRTLLDRVFAFILEDLTDERGFLFEAQPPELPRRQNPHMHMFEAMLSLDELLAYPEAAVHAGRYRKMLQTTFIDKETSLLVEHFDADWSSLPAEGAAPVEPGHLAEWVWLMRKHERSGGLKQSPLGTHFLGAALRAAEPLHGFLIDEIDTLGQVRKATRRLWPQTELIKAWLAQYEAGFERADEAAEMLIEAMLGTYLSGPFPGGWYDQYAADGTVMSEAVPASTLYHVFLASTEAHRLLG
ncbi:COG2942 N-acyl-D-glucosamine 2-epimerase [Rhabdaerophilaceae bacterium]